VSCPGDGGRSGAVEGEPFCRPFPHGDCRFSQVNFKLHQWAKTQAGMRAYCVGAFAE
jgi:hypothetical protein